MGEQEIELQQENIIVTAGGAVKSVNGYTGDVILTTSDLENTSDYQTGDEVDSAIATAIADKQDTLTAGANITIDGTTISATDTTYTAGTNVSISDQNVISATNTIYTAGTGLDLTGTTFSVDTDTIATKQSVTDEATARENADIGLQGQIDAISASSDVTDIVGTYAALQAYDTTHLKDNDIIKVLQDETHDGETTYYRWSTTTETFTLIGEEGPYYTKAATDTLLAAKQDTLTAGANITIEEESGTGDLVISATDTTYSNFTGTDGTAVGTAGLVPAPATTDAGKFLGASGDWEAIQASGVTVLTSADYDYPDATPDGVALWRLDGGLYTTNDGNTRLYLNTATFSTPAAGKTYLLVKDPSSNTNRVSIIQTSTNFPSVYLTNTATGDAILSGAKMTAPTISQNVGTSLTDVMSQKAVTSMVYADPSVRRKVCIGLGASSSGEYNIAIGQGANAYGGISVAIGDGTYSQGNRSVAIGLNATASAQGSIALGVAASATSQGEMNIGTNTTYGYNSSTYRLLTGLYDPQSAHDAATKGYVDGLVGNIESALNIINNGGSESE